jgi:stringent starvation protein B
MTKQEEKLISFRPYLLRAAYDWIVENDLTPYILVNTNHPNVHVPAQHIKNGRIILDITPRAVHRLKIDNKVVEFEARFGSQVNFISVPITAILHIYSREHGHAFPIAADFDQYENGDDTGFGDEAFYEKAGHPVGGAKHFSSILTVASSPAAVLSKQQQTTKPQEPDGNNNIAATTTDTIATPASPAKHKLTLVKKDKF